MSLSYLKKPKPLENKPKRITISLNRDIEKNLVKLQELMALETGKGWSFSKIINTLLLVSILNPDRLYNNEWVLVKNFSDGKRLPLIDTKINEYVTNLISLPNGI